MNERIKELTNQLGPVATIGNWGRIEWVDNVYPQLGDKMYAAIDLQKFAELIVQECVNVLHDNELCNRHISHALKEHFGVDE